MGEVRAARLVLVLVVVGLVVVVCVPVDGERTMRAPLEGKALGELAVRRSGGHPLPRCCRPTVGLVIRSGGVVVAVAV